jgi:AbrB family looped-hinge helix DNA binding protein
MRINKVTKMRKGIGRFINRRTKTGKKIYDRFFIYIPTEVARDTNFPLKDGDRIEVEIRDKTVIIRKAD